MDPSSKVYRSSNVAQLRSDAITPRRAVYFAGAGAGGGLYNGRGEDQSEHNDLPRVMPFTG
jgi:hypothetical protein